MYEQVDWVGPNFFSLILPQVLVSYPYLGTHLTVLQLCIKFVDMF